MPLTVTLKPVKLGNSVRMTIPVEVPRALRWNPANIVEIGLTDSQMIVKKTHK